VHCIIQTFNVLGRFCPTEKSVIDTIALGVDLKETFYLLDQTYFNEKDVGNTLWIETYRKIYKKDSLSMLCLFDGVKQIFKKICEKNISIMILKNKGKEAVENTINKFNLSSHVQFIVADTGGLKKPNPRIFDEFIQPKFGNTVNKFETIMIIIRHATH